MTTLRGPGVKSIGKPDAGNRHVRFDERAGKRACCHRALPRLYLSQENSRPIRDLRSGAEQFTVEPTAPHPLRLLFTSSQSGGT